MAGVQKPGSSFPEPPTCPPHQNTVPGDKSALVPGGLRMGTPALTSRGFVEADFEVVAALVDRGVTIAQVWGWLVSWLAV